MERVELKPLRRKNAGPMKRLTIDIPLKIHTKLKIECAASDRKMADVVRDLISAYLTKSSR
jgi:ParG protein